MEGETSSLNAEMSLTNTQDEAARLLEEMKTTIIELHESELYHKVLHQLQDDQTIQSNMKRVMGSDSHMQMVIYALGSIEFEYRSQFQLALAILLKHDFPHLIQDIEVYDPATTPNDAKVMKALGCNVLSVNEYCARSIERPTLFFMPSPIYEHIGNLLEANWCPSRLNRIVLLTNSLKRTVGHLNEREVIDSHVEERKDYMEAVLRYTMEFGIHDDEFNYRNPFFTIAWHFFDLYPDIDMDALLPVDPSKEVRLEMRMKREKDEDHFAGIHCIELRTSNSSKMIPAMPFESYTENKYSESCDDRSELYHIHRCPSRLQTQWLPPYTGWVKLNFSGRGNDGNNRGGYGGIFHNEHKECLASYAGHLCHADSTVANAEALWQGLQCLKYLPCVRKLKLVVEGDCLSIVRWANRAIEPPMRLMEFFHEMYGVLFSIECVILHCYKEANVMAIQLAEKGTRFPNHRIWINPQ